jgi:hypothetical protein
MDERILALSEHTEYPGIRICVVQSVSSSYPLDAQMMRRTKDRTRCSQRKDSHKTIIVVLTIHSGQAYTGLRGREYIGAVPHCGAARLFTS